MGNRAHRVNGAGRRERVVTPALQLGMSAQIQRDPQGVEWVGLTFGQATMSFTLAVPDQNVDEFLRMLEATVQDTRAKYRETTPAGSDLLVPKSGLIIPGNN